MAEIVWLVACVCTTLQCVIGIPVQCARILKRRHAADISKVSLCFQLMGFASWSLASTIKPINMYLLIPNSIGTAGTMALLLLAVVFGASEKGGATIT